MHRVRILSGLLASILILSACGGSDPATSGDVDASNGGAPADSPEDDSAVLRFAIWAPGPIAEMYKKQADEFAAADPRVDKVEILVEPFDRYHDVINVQLSSGEPPDLFWLAAGAGVQYVDAGVLLDLKPVMEEHDVELSDFPEQSLERWSSDGAVYGIPYVATPNVMFANLDAFAAAGLPDPNETYESGDWTWEYVQSAAKKIVDTGAARYGFSFHPAMHDIGAASIILEDIFAPYGATPWDESGKECRFDSPEMIDAVTVVHEMMYQDQSHPQPGTIADFPSGDVGMMLNRPRMAYDAKLADVAFDWTVLPVPSGPAGFRPGVGHSGLGVFKDSPHADIAADLAVELTSAESLTEMSSLLPPGRVSLQSVDVLAPVNALLTPQQIEESIIGAIDSEDASWTYTHQNWPAVSRAMDNAFDQFVFDPEANVPEAMSSVCDAIDALLG